MEEALKNCPLCGKTPASIGIEVWCENKECKLYNFKMPRENWQNRPIERENEKKIEALREDSRNRVNDFILLNNKYNALQKKYDSMASDIETARTSTTSSKKAYDILQESFNTFKDHAIREKENFQSKLDDEKRAVEYYKESARNNENSIVVLQNKYDILKDKYDKMALDMEVAKTSLTRTKGENLTLQKSFEEYRQTASRENNELKNKLNDEKKAFEYYKKSVEENMVIFEDALEKIYTLSSNILKYTKNK